MSELEKKEKQRKNISDLNDIITAQDIASVMGCSLNSAYDMMTQIGEFKPNIRNRRVFKTNFVDWLKSQGYKEDEVHEADPVIKMFVGADNRNVCTVVSANRTSRAGAHQSQGISH